MKVTTMAGPQRVFALTICAYRKPGMDEEEYHKYMSEQHAQSVKELMIENKIIDYTMVRLFLNTGSSSFNESHG
jgi:EthD domain